MRNAQVLAYSHEAATRGGPQLQTIDPVGIRANQTSYYHRWMRGVIPNPASPEIARHYDLDTGVYEGA